MRCGTPSRSDPRWLHLFAREKGGEAGDGVGPDRALGSRVHDGSPVRLGSNRSTEKHKPNFLTQAIRANCYGEIDGQGRPSGRPRSVQTKKSAGKKEGGRDAFRSQPAGTLGSIGRGDAKTRRGRHIVKQTKTIQKKFA